MSNFYCQLDYEHVPYLSPVGAANGNISNNGCGVCSASMVAENMLGVSFPPEIAGRFAKMCGARETWGTNFYVMAPAFAAHMGMTVRDTEDADEALRFLQEKRGMVIANTQGDREADGYIGVFSNSGHYIVIAEAEGTTVKVWDPMYKEGSGRYDVPGRKGKVRLDGTDAYADMSVLKGDCKDRPFFLFEKCQSPAPAPKVGVMYAGDGEEALSECRAYAKAIIQAGGVPMILSPDMPKEMVKDCVSGLGGLLVAGDACTETAEEAVRILEAANRPVICLGGCMKTAVSVMGGSIEVISADGSIIPVRGTRFEAVAGDPGSGAERPAETAGLPDTMRVCAVNQNGSIAAVERREGALFVGVNRLEPAETEKLFYALVESARV
ncbi:MAG: hypothetical protein IKM02_06040 [Clostridia bacterium]|nr:hypothetical protein [Clostridia bacterium]